jgi:5-methylcytosine-specific restriction endonuclease McrA
LEKDTIFERVKLAGIEMNTDQQVEYFALNDDLGEVVKGAEVPVGYKRCGRCGHSKKFYMFNKNNGSKTNTSGNCKECQKGSAKQSYGKTKQKRNYKKYYQENKEVKQAHARAYYEKNKDSITEKHKAYLQTKKGKKVMQKAHTKRRKALAANAGVPYTRDLIIERDSVFQGLEHPVCYLCAKPIEDISGKGLHMDHVVPVVTGGLDCFTNVASSHADCNLRREKDARELTPTQIKNIADLAAAYIDAHPDKFE